MHVTPDEAAKIYARHAGRGTDRAQAGRPEKVQEMRTRGDHSGIKAWEQVAAELDPEKRRTIERRLAYRRRWSPSQSTLQSDGGTALIPNG